MLIEDWPPHPEVKRLLDVWYVQRVEPLEQSGTVGKVSESIVGGKRLGPKTEESQNACCQSNG